MVCIREFHDKQRIYLSVTDKETDDPRHGTRLTVYRSLRRAEGIQPSICEQNFLSEMSRKVEQENASATYVLKNTFQERPAIFDLLPMLGRSIISDSIRWGSNQLRIYGDFNFIAGYWEWTEDILFRFEEPLQLSSIYDAVYASLYSYAKDINIMRAFCESWCPTTNTLHTQLGELSISLWDLYKLGGLPISGEIYDETVPPYDYFLARDKDGDRVLPQACDFLFAAYHYLAKQPESKKGVSAQQWVKYWYKGEINYASPVKRQRNSNSAPKHTHNPDGVLKDRPTTWTQGESALFDSLGIFGESRRQTTYVAAFLSCWLCAFVLPENDQRLIRPSTFEMATLMARGQTFSLAIPVLASIYRGLNVISRSSKPAYSGASFPTHYVYGWLAHYFNTNYVVDPPPAGPLMVVFSGAQGAKCFNGQEARALIHEGSRAEVGCTILNKNRIELLFDDGTLKPAHFDYLVSLRTGFLPLRFRDSFHIEPYTPYRFSRQFGFRQDIPSMLSRSVSNRTVTYYEALRYWTLWLFKGSRSRVYAPCVALNWHDLTTPRFQNWWSKVSISDLRDKVVVLCSSIESDPSRTKRKPPNDARDVAQPHRIDSNPEPIAKTQSLHISSVKDAISTKVNKVFGNDRSTSDAESDEGDIDFETGVSFNVDGAMIEEATEPLNVLTDRTVPEKGKDIHIEKDLVERSNPASPAQSQHSVDGPSTFEINAKTLGTPLDDSGIPRAPSHGDVAHAPSISTIRVTPASQGIFTSAIKILGNEYLTLLKQTPFDKVSDRHGEASQVYKAIRMMHGDPEPLKCKVDGYVWAVKGHLALKASLSDRRRSDQVEEERLAAVEELKLAESSYDTALTKHKGLEEESAALKRREDELLKELEDVRQRMDQVTSDLGDNKNSMTTLEATVHATKRRVEELEAVPVCSAEEMELFEEQERKLLEFQSSLDSSEWIV
ncbi:Tropomyosin [Bienertia sinuspersici]